MTKHIALIRGDGIGPEIIEQARLVLDKIAALYGHKFTYTEVAIDFDTGVITDITTGKTYQAEPFPDFIQNIIKKGGLLASLKEM